MRKALLKFCGVLALSIAAQAHATIVFDNSSRQDFQSSRSAGDSPLASITVSSTQFLNQIGAQLNPNSNGNLKFVVFNLDTQALLFSTAPVAFTDVGSAFYLSPIFSPVQLNTGTNYGIGAIADVGGLWGISNGSSGNPFSQGGFTASDDSNGNVSGFANPVLGSGGSAMIIVQLGVDTGNTGVIPLPPTAWLMLAGMGALGVAARRRKAA